MQRTASTHHIKRKLGIMEGGQWLLGRQNAFNVVVCAEISGPEFTQQTLENAAAVLQLRHFYLHSRISDEDYPFIKDYDASPIPVRCLPIQNTSAINETIDQELHKLFDDKYTSLCRVNYLYDRENHGYMLLTMHHAICDGVSAMHVCAQLIDILSGLSDTPQVLSLGSYPALPAMEQLFPEKVKELSTSVAPAERIKPPQMVNYPADKLHTQFLQESLSVEETAELRTFLHANQLTMQPYLLACLASSVFTYALRHHQQLSSLDVDCNTLVNMRRYLQREVSNNELGCYISAFNSPVILSGQPVLELAQALKADIQAKLNQGVHYTSVFLFDELLNKKTPKAECDFAAKVPYICVSNCGVTEVKSSLGKYTLHGITPYVTIHNEFNNNYSCLMLCNTYNGALTLNFHYPHPVISELDAKLIMQDCRQRILSIKPDCAVHAEPSHPQQFRQGM